jgi:hypothetical protein
MVDEKTERAQSQSNTRSRCSVYSSCVLSLIADRIIRESALMMSAARLAVTVTGRARTRFSNYKTPSVVNVQLSTVSRHLVH